MKVRKKPVLVNATQFLGDRTTLDDGTVLLPFAAPEGDGRHCAYVPTLEGVMRADPGDWIITGVKGEHYPCKPDVVARTYDIES